jgi:hypothetical protein
MQFMYLMYLCLIRLYVIFVITICMHRFQQSMGTPSGQAESKRYNDNIREQTVRWGMVEMLKNPPKGFEIVVKTHFKLRKESILRQIARWAEEASSSRRSAFKSLQKTMAIQIEQAIQN